MAERMKAGHRALFTATILVGSFLLFMVQPLIARMALPRLGGAPNVWNSAMVVYQALLLGGYAYAHYLSRFRIARQGMIHLALLLLAGLTLPLTLRGGETILPGMELFWVPWLFLVTVGPVFFVVSAQAPLMQSWFAADRDAGDPYALYAASNLGSFGGLLAYPILVEPMVPLGSQTRWWAAGYLVLVILVAVSWLARRKCEGHVTLSEQPCDPTHSRPATWLVLSAVPSGLMLSTTTFLTTDIMAMPLLWVIPLGLYLLSFSVAFSSGRRFANWLVLVAPLAIILCARVSVGEQTTIALAPAIAAILLLFLGAVALHSRLYQLRPAASDLTRFYLFVSLGGVIGGAFTALAAPLIFDWTWEHPVLILALVALLPLQSWEAITGKWNVRPALLRSFLVILTLFVMLVPGLANQFGLSRGDDRTRSYFGIYTKGESEDGQRWLMHGTTIHGAQIAGGTQPTMYYGHDSGVGRALRSLESSGRSKAEVGVVGLGVGTLACYRKPGQKWTFFEIDTAVLDYSRSGDFTFLSECAPNAKVVIGDARLKLEKVRDGSYDLLVIDAFSSDSIPMHLLTAEAMDLYSRKVASDGILAVHITNRYMKLEPVIASLADEAGLRAIIRRDPGNSGENTARSIWVVLAADTAALSRIQALGGWDPIAEPEGEAWTDDYSSILPYIDWKKAL